MAVSLIVIAWCALFAQASVAARSVGAGRLFARGANLCKLVSTAKLDAALGLRFPPPAWGGAFCRWEIRGGRVTQSVWLSVRRGVGRKAVDSMVRDERRVTVTKVTVPGASYALVASAGYRGAVRDTVLAVFPEGTVFVTITIPKLTVPAAAAVATAVLS